MSITLSTSFPGNFSRAVTPEMDRRAHTDRRVPLMPMPQAERSWARHALVAGCIGAVLGSSAAMAVLQQRELALPESVATNTNMHQAVPEAAIMAPMFDTTPFAPPSTSTRPSAGSESYSEDAAGVPSATYHEPPPAQAAKAQR